MATRSKSVCRLAGCGVLIDVDGYCTKYCHQFLKKGSGNKYRVNEISLEVAPTPWSQNGAIGIMR